MQRKTSPPDNVAIAGDNNQGWFEQNFAIDNIEIEESVAFAVSDLSNLLAQPDCNEIVLSKQTHNGKKTLAVAGINTNSVLQVANFDRNDGTVVEHLVLIGTHYTKPTSTATFTFDFSSMKANIPNPEWTTLYDETGPFDTLVNRYNRKTNREVNYFSTVNFSSNKIRKLIIDHPGLDKVAFIAGFATLVTIDTVGPVDNIHRATVKRMTNLETLVAVAVDAADNVMGTDVVIADFPWPIKWKPYG